jgi:uncharacterized RDD family membrane protein YckC
VTYALDSDKLVIGRSRSCDIRLREDTVSRLHAAFIPGPAGLVLEDLGSSNGTFLNEQRVLGPRAVVEGDTVRFGALCGTIERLDALPPARGDEGAPTGDLPLGVIEAEPAGLGLRLLALLADAVAFAVGSLVPLAPLLAVWIAERYLVSPGRTPFAWHAGTALAGACGALWLVYAFHYVVGGWATRGRTPGMRVLGLRLLDWRRRTPIGYSRAILRAAACSVTLLTLGLGFLTVAFRKDRKALHDLLAGTIVVRPRLGRASPPA